MADKLNEIINEHLMSMDFDVHSDKCTPTERALFFRMKDVAFAFTAFKNKELQRQLEISQLEAKYNLDTASVIREEYTELQKQVESLQIVKDELLKQVEELKWQVVTSDNEYLNIVREYYQLKEAADKLAYELEGWDEYNEDLETYKQLTTPKT